MDIQLQIPTWDGKTDVNEWKRVAPLYIGQMQALNKYTHKDKQIREDAINVVIISKLCNGFKSDALKYAEDYGLSRIADYLPTGDERELIPSKFVICRQSDADTDKKKAKCPRLSV